MQTNFSAAIGQICEEKNIPKNIVIETIEAALAAAYKKDYGSKNQEVRVDMNEETGEIIVYVSKEVVETVEDSFTQIGVMEADRLKKGSKVGDIIEIKDFPNDFGRIAAQTAKQVIIQRIREAERDIVFGEYKDKEGEVINGIIQRIEGNNVIVDIGKASGILFPKEQVQGERYYIGQRLKFFVVRVEQNTKGPQIIISRSHPGLVKRLFELEVPEILSGVVEIKSIAREAGQRTKIAVTSNQEGVDPVGSCVGQRGVRVQAVMNEIGAEKIDIILWDEDARTFISNALSPAKVSTIAINEEEKKAEVTVTEDQLSLAIGRSGQNVRLAAKLTGYNVDIKGGDESGVEAASKILRPVEDKRDLEDELLKAVELVGEEPEKSSDQPTDLEKKEEVKELLEEEKGSQEVKSATAEAKVIEKEKGDQNPVKVESKELVTEGEIEAKEKNLEEESTKSADLQKGVLDADDGIDEIAQILEEEQRTQSS